MSEKDADISIKHILVALDSSAHSIAALEEAASLAKDFEAELEGLFVEDINWFYLSRFPFLSEITERTASKRTIDMEKEVKAQAERIRRVLKHTGEQSKIKYSFRTVRGKVEHELLSASSNVDIITLGRIGQSYIRDRTLGKTALSLLRQTEKPILFLQTGPKRGASVIVIIDESEVSERSLKLAAHLSKKRNSNITILLTDHQNSRIKLYHQFIQETLKNHPNPHRIQLIDSDNLHEINTVIQEENSGLLIASRDNVLFSDNNLDQTLGVIPCALLLLS